MELRHLRYAVAVADELHFARAAARLHIAQPPLSQQIRALEDELGVRLFERTSRRVRLTDAGAAFVDEARRTLASAERAADVARRAARGETGRLAIGYVSSASYELLPAILRAFRRITPDAALVLEEMSSAEQSRALAAGTLDLGFVRRPPPVERHLAATLVLRESIVVAVPRDHALARARAIRLRQLAREAFVIYPVRPRPSWADVALELCRAAGFEPRVVHEALEMVSALSLVAAGIGVALVPAAVRAVRRPGVVFRPLAPAPSTEVLLVRRDEPPTGLIARFLEVVAATRPARVTGGARR
ncbi:MAG TPA: LysR substrate-binding domain-containing protein [Kofleriaceae bacterium]|jgi:DNA-binding transcriptional LysR family regulator|nr:LysR substrate-binding domain-containing protein [Kofleriaceae bacterium]